MKIRYTQILLIFIALVSVQAQAAKFDYIPSGNEEIFGSLNGNGATHFVDINAMGANDGSSWGNAFTDLKAALSAAQEGDTLWVAEGQYLPDTTGGSPLSTFLFNKNMVMLGGFSGDETFADERDPGAYPTVLSGDLNGDDVSEDLDSNRVDNVLTVLLVGEEVTPTALIDGFTIRNGSANGGTSDFFLERGGGLFSFGAPRIRNCFFTENYAFRDGGALYFQGLESDSALVSQCRFFNNAARDEGGALMLFQGGEAGIFVDSCSFEENFSERRGGAIRLVKSSISIRNSEFINNECLRSGGAISSNGLDADYLRLDVDNCQFTGNRARNGGAVRFIGNAFFGLFDNQLKFVNCSFTENQALDLGPGDNPRGGALDIAFNQQSNEGLLLIEGCVFEGNSSENASGAVYVFLGGQGNVLEIKESQFLGNSARGIGALEIRGASVGVTNADVSDCLFEGNLATDLSAGALSVIATENADLTAVLSECHFLSNEAIRGGGALVLNSNQNGKLNIETADCLFEGNTGGDSGGSIAVFSDNGNLRSRIRRCTFEGSSAGEGGVFFGMPFFSNSFEVGSSIVFENCLMHDNSSDGALIACDSFPGLTLLHCTIAGNDADGIKTDQVSSLLMQNNILFNPGYTEMVDASENLLFTSFGGNLFGDSSAVGLLTATDIVGADPLFDGSGNYELTESSPAVDAGILSNGLPAVDLNGDDRVQGSCVDVGAIESPFDLGKDCLVSSTEEKQLAQMEVELFPNPVFQSLQIVIGEENWRPSLVRIFNAFGQEVQTRNLNPVFDSFSLNVGDLTPGMYTLILESDEGKRVQKKFIKH
jgi:predicted outer membrane repeat protein